MSQTERLSRAIKSAWVPSKNKFFGSCNQLIKAEKDNTNLWQQPKIFPINLLPQTLSIGQKLVLTFTNKQTNFIQFGVILHDMKTPNIKMTKQKQ
jgi:hypothetical protein